MFASEVRGQCIPSLLLFGGILNRCALSTQQNMYKIDTDHIERLTARPLSKDNTSFG